MRHWWILAILLIPALLIAEAPKKVTVTGATWASPSGERQNPAKTHVVETDDTGLISKVYDAKKPSSGLQVVSTDGQSHYSFMSQIVKITVDVSWNKLPDGSVEILYAQQNDVPEQIVAGKKFPKEVAKKSFSVLLSVSSPEEYSWVEKREASWLPEDGRSSYARSAQGVVWTQNDEKGEVRYKTVLNGHTSDAAPDSTGQMFYSQTKNSVVGKYYWTMEPAVFSESTWNKGGRIEYTGDPLSKDPLVNVINYYILRSWFSDNAWNYFGPSLFGIAIK